MKIDNYFDLNLSKTISYADVELNVNFNVMNPILAEYDKNAPTLINCDCNL